jgi:DNA-binding LytR/AlgR family response regulator
LLFIGGGAALSIAYGMSQLAASGDASEWPELFAGELVKWGLCLPLLPIIGTVARRWPVGGERRHRLNWIIQGAAVILLALVKMAVFVAAAELLRLASLTIDAVVEINYEQELLVTAVLAILLQLPRPRLLQNPLWQSARAGEQFLVRHGESRLVIPADRIIWADAQGNYVRLHTAEGRHLLRTTMSSLEQRLDPARFVRVHRRAIVNRACIVRIERRRNGGHSLELSDGERIVASRSYSEQVARLDG